MIITFDIGGTNIRVSSSRDGKTLDDIVIEKTPQNFEEGVRLIEYIIKKLSRGEKITAVAGGVAGPLDSMKSMIVNPPNLPEWSEKPLKKILEEICDAPVYLENDTAMIGLGEAHAPTLKNKKIVAYITVSTGIGGTRIVDGKIDVSSKGFEPGHQIINFSGEPHTFEELASGSGIGRRFGKDPATIEDQKVWDEVAHIIAVGLNNVTVMWSPEIIILGGSVVLKRSPFLFEQIKFHFKKIHTIFNELPTLKEAELDDRGGLIGSLFYLQNKNYFR